MDVLPVFCDPPSAREQGQIIRESYSLLTDVLREPLYELHCRADITERFFVVFDVFPFAAGAQRLAFKGSIYERSKKSDPEFQAHVVVKMEMALPEMVSKSSEERTRMTLAEAEKTIKKHEIASKVAEEWCSQGINKSVYFLSTEKIKIVQGCSLEDIDIARYPMLHHLFKKLSLDSVLYRTAVGTVEDFLPGIFTKFLNNDGATNEKIIANFPSAFAHWSWVHSKGEFMVSDIQGVRTGSGYILTDPCVHSVADSEGFGMSDLGMGGIEEFFERHKCNDLCRDLNLGKDKEDLDLGHSLRTRVKQSTVLSNKLFVAETNATNFGQKSLELRNSNSNLNSDGKLRRRATMKVCEKRENEKIPCRETEVRPKNQNLRNIKFLNFFGLERKVFRDGNKKQTPTSGAQFPFRKKYNSLYKNNRGEQ